jgi:hypothetical protein
MISLAAFLSLVCLASGQDGSKPPPAEERPPAAPSKGPQTGGGSAAPAKPARSGLEKALEEALKNNPDLRVAAAKVSEADAVLARARLQVTQKVVAAYQTIEMNKATSDAAQKRLTSLRELKSKLKGAVSQDDVALAEQAVSEAKARLATAEADLDYLLGKTAARTAAFFLGYRMATSTSSAFPYSYGLETYGRGISSAFQAQGFSGTDYNPFGIPVTGLGTTRTGSIPSSDKIRTVLDRRISIKFSDTPASEALKMLQKEAQGLHIQASLKDDVWKEKITATLTDVPFGAALQLLEDVLTDHQIIVRGYGLLIVKKQHVPAGGVPLDAFWQSGVARDPRATSTLGGIAKSDTEANPPVGKVEGTVTRVDDGLVMVSVGSDAGLAKGNTLEVFRLGTTPRYLGRLRIIEVKPTSAIGRQVAGGTKQPIKSGDRVASQVTSAK